jgi:hypothetical protein
LGVAEFCAHRDGARNAKSTTGTASWRARFIAVTVSLSELELTNVPAV